MSLIKANDVTTLNNLVFDGFEYVMKGGGKSAHDVAVEAEASDVAEFIVKVPTIMVSRQQECCCVMTSFQFRQVHVHTCVYMYTRTLYACSVDSKPYPQSTRLSAPPTWTVSRTRWTSTMPLPRTRAAGARYTWQSCATRQTASNTWWINFPKRYASKTT